MSALARQQANFTVHPDVLSEQPDLFRALVEFPAKSPLRLIAHKQDRALLAPEVVLQVVPDPPRLAHAAGRQDYLRFRIVVDGFGVLAGDGDLQPLGPDGVDPLVHQSPRLLVQAFPAALQVNAGGLVGQRAVHVYREIIVACTSPFCLISRM